MSRATIDSKVFRFQDTRDFDYAYVIANSRSEAAGLLKEHTELEIIFGEEKDCVRPLDDFPKAVKHFEKYKNSVWICDIKPF